MQCIVLLHVFHHVSPTGKLNKHLQKLNCSENLLLAFSPVFSYVFVAEEFADIRDLLSKDVNTLAVKDFCQPFSYSSQAPVTNYVPLITYFKLDKDCEAILKPLFEYQKSMIFRQIWKKSFTKLLKKVGDGKVTVALVASDVWSPAESIWKSLCEQIISGDVLFCAIDEYTDGFNRQYKKILTELQLACANKELAVRRCKQIEQYHRLSEYTKGAAVMLDLRKIFELKGNFDVVEDLNNLVCIMKFSHDVDVVLKIAFIIIFVLIFCYKWIL